MAVVILTGRDTGEQVSAVELCERILSAVPEAVCRPLHGGRLDGVETSDAAARGYLMSIDTADGRERG